ncbi:MAG TPA: biotin carboxylase N-terminal domain-containing protein [Methylocella sp.]|nr:biotin carboxylase N-terminal domain-containing protein [Methylocella sp.]
MFSKILIASRGEIACRIIMTAHRLGIETAAVYSDADRGALHVEKAGEAFAIGSAPARESYLDGGKILEAALRCGAEAIHPGYGFLSENADFAEACAGAGIVFIGPPASAMRAIGNKARAKALMEEAGVPLLPGYHGTGQSEALLAEEAQALGYPVLIKAAAGGGGKGMKIAASPADFARELASAKREALAAFGDDRVIIEKYLTLARHVEVQIFADAQGNFVHLFERDCSIQRRHQKIIEEAPAPELPEKVSKALREAALSVARAAGYIGAGTVEFLYSPAVEAFYFLEMNTRLQVEHPVTEMITGTDLVEWQLHVAAGGALPLKQEDIRSGGHAVEARLYAEDPARGFLPQPGRIERLDFPSAEPGLRIDTGVRAGDTIPPDYDPMIAKVIAWGPDRDKAIARLRGALSRICVAGVTCNLDLLRAIAADSAFHAGPPDTEYIARHGAALLPVPESASREALALAAAGLLCARQAAAKQEASRSQDPWSPWHGQQGWRLHGQARETLRFGELTSGMERMQAIEVAYGQEGWRLDVAGTRFFDVRGRLAGDGTLSLCLDGHKIKAVWLQAGEEITVLRSSGQPRRFRLTGPSAPSGKPGERPGRLVAPMPGRVSALLVEPGAKVEANQPLLILEAMKMEHMLRAPNAGILVSFCCAPGGQVAEGAELALLETEA